MSHLPGSIVGKDEFIDRLAKKLGRDKPLMEAPSRSVRGVPDFYADRKLNTQEKLDLFVHNWTTLTGKVLIVKEAVAGPASSAYLRQICAELEVDKVVRWDHEQLNSFGLDEYLAMDGIHVIPWKKEAGNEPYNGILDKATSSQGTATDEASVTNWSKRSTLLQNAEKCRIGIVWADYALAETGTVVLCAKGGNGRSVSLLPDTLIAVFRADQLLGRMGEAFDKIARDDKYAEIRPSSINLITGPSRSADIENDLTIGIHGPGKVFAIIIE